MEALANSLAKLDFFGSFEVDAALTAYKETLFKELGASVDAVGLKKLFLRESTCVTPAPSRCAPGPPRRAPPSSSQHSLRARGPPSSHRALPNLFRLFQSWATTKPRRLQHHQQKLPLRRAKRRRARRRKQRLLQQRREQRRPQHRQRQRPQPKPPKTQRQCSACWTQSQKGSCPFPIFWPPSGCANRATARSRSPAHSNAPTSTGRAPC
jgi:hypothetical protein